MKKERSIYKVNKKDFSFVETDSSSVFQLTNFPKVLSKGKNYFKISVSDGILEDDTEIHINVVDSNSKPIYYEISNLVNEDLSRNVVIYVYPDTASGKCTVQIFGTLKGGSHSNYIFETYSYVDISKKSETDIIFKKIPRARYKEDVQTTQTTISQTRLTELKNTTGSISIKSTLIPRQMVDTQLEVETKGIQNTTSFPTLISDKITNSTLSTPEHFGNSIINSKGFTFISDMKGGMIYINGISLISPNDFNDSSLFQNHSYSASIINVESSKSIEVYPPFNKSFTYTSNSGEKKYFSTDKIINHSNFTCSYYSLLSLTGSIVSKSYVTFDLYDLNSEIGNVDTVKISYKPSNDFGDYRPAGEFKIVNQNLLKSTSSLQFSNEGGISEKEIGSFTNGISDFQNSWSSSSFGTGSIIVDTQNLNLKNGIRIYQTASRGISDRWEIRPNRSHNFYIPENTNLALRFDSFSTNDGIFNTSPQVDIYITGSSIKNISSDRSDISHQKIATSSFGTYIGSISGKNQKKQKNEFQFTSVSDGYLKPVFVFRSGIWELANIRLETNEEDGFTPNQNRIHVPLENLDTGTELILKIQYLNESGKSSNFENLLYGAFFQGNDTPQDQVIQKFDNGSKITYIVSREGFSIDNVSNANITFSIPFFRDEYGIAYSGSNYFVSLAYQTEIVISGYSGSYDAQKASYTWAGTLQGRGLVSTVDNSGQPLLFDVIAFSGSTERNLGTYGGNTVKTNIDSWFSLRDVTAVSDGTVRFRYTVRSSGGQIWNASMVAICNIIKYEKKF